SATTPRSGPLPGPSLPFPPPRQPSRVPGALNAHPALAAPSAAQAPAAPEPPSRRPYPHLVTRHAGYSGYFEMLPICHKPLTIMRWAPLADLMGPVEGVGLVAVLEADQLRAQAHGHRAGLAVRDQ